MTRHAIARRNNSRPNYIAPRIAHSLGVQRLADVCVKCHPAIIIRVRGFLRVETTPDFPELLQPDPMSCCCRVADARAKPRRSAGRAAAMCQATSLRHPHHIPLVGAKVSTTGCLLRVVDRGMFHAFLGLFYGKNPFALPPLVTGLWSTMIVSLSQCRQVKRRMWVRQFARRLGSLLNWSPRGGILLRCGQVFHPRMSISAC